MKRTPGPWTVHVISDETIETRIQAGAEILARVCDFGKYRIVEQEGNANLFAAAPAMYEALQSILDSENSTLGDGGSILGDDYRSLLQAALAQAEGWQP